MSTLLPDLLDTLIPGDETFPAPSKVGLAEKLLAHERFGPTMSQFCCRLPANFSDIDAAGRVALLTRMEEEHPEAFGAFLVGVYSLYYTDTEVLAGIAKISGYEARPPQPLGYELEPFDTAMVAVPAARPAHYRTTS